MQIDKATPLSHRILPTIDTRQRHLQHPYPISPKPLAQSIPHPKQPTPTPTNAIHPSTPNQLSALVRGVSFGSMRGNRV